MTTKKIIQWAVYFIIGTWGFLSFCILAGEEAPTAPMSIGKFIAIKALAGISLYACYRVGKVCDKQGMFPDIKMPEDEMED